jgi:hypothetical protein
VTPNDLDRLRIDAAQRAHERETEFANNANKAAIDSGTLTVKSILLVNGGSCVAILAFIGTLATKYRPISAFALPLIVFAVGAGFSILASAAGYFTNLSIADTSMYRSREYQEPFLRDNDQSNRRRFWGQVFRCLGIGFAILGVASFFIGLFFAYRAFRYL